MTNFTEKYRPRIPKQLIGESQKKAANYLMENQNPPKIVLFVGPSGTGKTSIAKMFVRRLLDLSEDERIEPYISYYNCGFNTGVDFIREVTDSFMYLPSMAKLKIYFLDEIHRLTQQAQDCLLTPLESLPDYVVIVGATTEKTKIMKTLLSRFSIYTLKIPTEDEFIKKANTIIKKEKPELFPFDDKTARIVQEIIDRSGGNVRMFDEFLGQLIEDAYSSDEGIQSEDNFSFWFLFKAYNVSAGELFKVADDITDYNGASVMLCRMAYNTIRNGRANPQAIARCKRVLEIFGDGLSPYTDEKISFAKRILDI